jgi:bifunctional enzyme CysN/CysC
LKSYNSSMHERERPAPDPKDVFTVAHRVGQEDRAGANRHRGGILWFTGLSGAGKSTLAIELERALFSKRYQVYTLDGDNVRQGLSVDLGFSHRDRSENIRRIGEVAALFAEAGLVAIAAFISPYRADRDRIRAAHARYFSEIYINAPIEVCEARDTKGLYRRARAGEVKDFTGVSAPYEPPLAPDLEVRSGEKPVQACLAELLAFVERRLSLE